MHFFVCAVLLNCIVCKSLLTVGSTSNAGTLHDSQKVGGIRDRNFIFGTPLLAWCDPTSFLLVVWTGIHVLLVQN